MLSVNSFRNIYDLRHRNLHTCGIHGNPGYYTPSIYNHFSFHWYPHTCCFNDDRRRYAPSIYSHFTCNWHPDTCCLNNNRGNYAPSVYNNFSCNGYPHDADDHVNNHHDNREAPDLHTRFQSLNWLLEWNNLSVTMDPEHQLHGAVRDWSIRYQYWVSVCVYLWRLHGAVCGYVSDAVQEGSIKELRSCPSWRYIHESSETVVKQ